MEGLSSLTGVVRLHEVCMPVQAAAAKAVYLSWEDASSLAAPIATGADMTQPVSEEIKGHAN